MKRRLYLLPVWLLLILVGVTALPVAPVAAASGTATPPVAPPGTLFTFTAEGFIPRERVDAWVTMPDATPVTPSIGRYVADDAGRVSWSWTAPGNAVNGIWVMTAIGVDSDLRIGIPFEIQGTPVEPPQPPQSVTPTSGPRGTTFIFVAGGFEPGEQVGPWLTRPDGSTMSLPDEAQAVDLYADPTGFVSWNWTAPADAPTGNWSSQAQGISSDRLVSIPFQIQEPGAPPPPESVTPTSGPPGTVFTFTAGGFIPGEEVGSWLNPPGGGNQDATSYLVADKATGMVTWTWTAPADAAGGRWRMIAKGDTSGREVVFTFDVLSAPAGPAPEQLQNVTPTNGLPGTEFFFYAEGFTPFESIHYWVINPEGLPDPNSKQEEASGEGIAEWSWDSPDDAMSGEWVMTVRGGVSRTEYQIPFTINRPDYVPPETGVVPTVGSPGTEFTFAATGYNGSEYLSWWLEGPNNSFIDGTIRDVKSNSDGYARWQWVAPDEILAGQWRLFAKGVDSFHLQVIEFSIVRDTPPPQGPRSGVTPSSGPPGTTFEFFAEGYLHDEVVGYWLNDPDGEVVRVDKEVLASEEGIIQWSWTAPADAKSGQWQMIARSTGLRYNRGVSKNDVMHVIPFWVE